MYKSASCKNEQCDDCGDFNCSCRCHPIRSVGALADFLQGMPNDERSELENSFPDLWHYLDRFMRSHEPTK